MLPAIKASWIALFCLWIAFLTLKIPSAIKLPFYFYNQASKTLNLGSSYNFKDNSCAAVDAVCGSD